MDSGQGFAPDLLVPEDSSALITTEELPSPGSAMSQPIAASAYDTSIEQLVSAAMETTPSDLEKPSSISKPSPTVINAVAQDPRAVIPTTTTPEMLLCPHPHDVLMPVSGYQLWAGNCRYMNAVNARKEAFAKSGDRSEEAKIALEIVHHIHEQRPAGRFLTAIEVPVAENPNANVPANGNIISTTMWQVMRETEVLQQLGKHLRETKKEKKRHKKHKRKHKKKKRKVEEEAEESISNMGALQSLYYIPTYYPTPESNSLSLEESSSSSESSSEEEPSPPPPPPPPPPAPKIKKPRAPPKQKAAPKPKPAPKAAPTNSKPVSFHYKPKPMKSQRAALENEGEISLPKGVTVRPSGKWQAQTYFAGQSRYVGVYETSRLAAHAYVVVQEYLRQYRESNRVHKESPKEELAKIFASARKAADDAVKELQKQGDEELAPGKSQAARASKSASKSEAIAEV